MVAEAIAYVLTVIFVVLGTAGLRLGFTEPTSDQRTGCLTVGIVCLGIAYGCARLGGI